MSEVTPCIHSTLTKRRMATTLRTHGGEEPRWMNSSEAQSWADRYFPENTMSCAQPVSECIACFWAEPGRHSNHIPSNQCIPIVDLFNVKQFA